MNSSDELPMSVSTRKMRSSRTISRQVTVTFHRGYVIMDIVPNYYYVNAIGE